MTVKLYHGPFVDVSDERELCIHSGVCLAGMSAVFDLEQRPWINPDHAASADLVDQLREVVGRCPSGALKIVEHSNETP